MVILRLSDPASQNNSLTGGKGSSLAKMISAGLSVPDGFVLTTEAYSSYSKLDIDTIPSDFKAQTIKAFEDMDTEYVAVRSSANCEDGVDNSFAGQFDSFLNTPKDNLIENILKCWDSINSPRCQEYLREKNIISESVKVAVVVQKMIQSEVSGIAFTVNPVTNNNTEIMIEAGYGLGEAIVSGQITPDNYLVNKQNLTISEKSISDQTKKLVLQNKQNTWLEIPQTSSKQQKISDNQIAELSKICLQIEAYYNHPCDIEWAFTDDQFFVTQSRPITTMLEKITEIIKLDFTTRRDTTHISNEITAISLLSLYNDLVLQPKQTNHTLVAVKYVDNEFEIYIDNQKFEAIRTELKEKILSNKIKLADIYVKHLNFIDQAKYSTNDKEFIEYNIEAGKCWAYLWFALSIIDDADIVKLKPIVRLLEKFREEDTHFEDIDTRILNDGEYSIDARYKMSIEDYVTVGFDVDTSKFKHVTHYSDLLHFDPTSIEFHLHKDNQIDKIGVAESTPSENTQADIRLSQHKKYNPRDFITLFSGRSMPILLSDLFLKKYSDFGTLSMQTGGTWITYLPKSTQKMTLEYGALLYTNAKEYLEYKTAFDDYKSYAEKKLNTINTKLVIVAPDVEDFFQTASDFWLHYPKTEFFYTDDVDLSKMIPSIHEFDKLKLDGRKFLNRISFEEDGFVQTLVNKIAFQVNIDFDKLMQYTISELLELLKNNKIISEKELKKRESYFSDGKNNIYEADSLVKPFIENYLAPSKIIHGSVAYKGFVKGYARILNPDYTDFESIGRAIQNMNQGDILIAQSTSPEIIPAIKKASAIVTNQGGVLSHAAIIAREFKIPCIIGTDKDVTQVIKDGDLIEVDATNGLITIF
jgi:phosphoenolpyruvate synthase/pyruvate phosphate dikinase